VTAEDAPAILTTGLGKRYGSTWALQDCSLSVPPGRITALVGPNGAGKTTLLKLLVGLSTPTTGEARVLDQVPQQDETFLATIGYLAQDVPLYNRLSAEEHLLMGAQLNRR
jgi:ABC-2 type transport system ATP-binding protein